MKGEKPFNSGRHSQKQYNAVGAGTLACLIKFAIQFVGGERVLRKKISLSLLSSSSSAVPSGFHKYVVRTLPATAAVIVGFVVVAHSRIVRFRKIIALQVYADIPLPSLLVII